MDKKNKADTNNQWTSLPEEPLKNSGCSTKKEKTETDNQWTTTAKNDPSQK